MLLKAMEVYLVRHGRTDGNVAHRHQHLETHLNETGKEQAQKAAAQIKDLRPTHLICSTNVRAVQSASYIASLCDLIPETYPPFEELHQPAFLVGERMLSYTSLSYIVRWFFGIPSATMHDGETYSAFVSRLKEARMHLEQLPSNARVVIVSHSVFISFFTEHMLRPEKMGLWRAFFLFLRILTLRNSSITHVRYEKPLYGHKTGWSRVHSK